MAIASNSEITAANYNTLQNRVANILGAGTGQLGYGQDTSSSLVTTTSIITADHLRKLKDDINKIYVHQFGSLSNLEVIDPTDIIGADAVDGDPLKGWTEYVSVINNIEDDPDRIDGTQFTIETGISSTRTSPWNGMPVHSFTVTFTDETHRRAFFNAGGEIWMSGSVAGDNTEKGQNWTDMLSNMGTIKFGKNSTTKDSGGGQVYAIGNYQLTLSYQQIYFRQGNGDAYNENRIFIYAKETSNRSIQFRLEFSDADVGDPNIDELVYGTLDSQVQQRRPTGSYVSIASPSYSNQSDLGTGS